MSPLASMANVGGSGVVRILPVTSPWALVLVAKAAPLASVPLMVNEFVPVMARVPLENVPWNRVVLPLAMVRVPPVKSKTPELLVETSVPVVKVTVPVAAAELMPTSWDVSMTVLPPLAEPLTVALPPATEPLVE